MSHEYTQEEWRVIELGRVMYTIYHEAKEAYFDKEFYPGFQPSFALIPAWREAILRDADLLAKRRGYEGYDPTAYDAAVAMVRNAENQERYAAQRKEKERLDQEWESEAKAHLWNEVVVDLLKQKGVYDKKVSLTELETKHIAWDEDRQLRWTANAIAKQRGFKFRY